MTLLLQEYRRRLVVPVACLAALAYYLFVYVPLGRKTAELDMPLKKAWQSLTDALEKTNAYAVDFLTITNQLEKTRQGLAIVDTAHAKAAERLELSRDLQARLTAPFQLVDYENERSKAAENWMRLAKTQQVTIEPALYSGFPEHTADVRQPELLWPALSMIHGLVTSAINAKLTMLHGLEVPVILTNNPATNSQMALYEVPIQLEFTGAVPNVARLLQSIPLRAKEITDANLPATIPDKPPLFLDRLILKKQSPEKPDEVRVWVRVLGFVLRE